MYQICDKKWVEVNDLSGGQNSANKKTKSKTPILRSDLCDYNNSCFVVKGRISITDTSNTNRENKKLTFKNNLPIKSCITKFNNTFMDNADLDM